MTFHFPDDASTTADACALPSTYSCTELPAEAFWSVPLRDPGDPLVPLWFAVTTGALTATFVSQVVPYWEVMLARPAEEIIGKNAPNELPSHAELFDVIEAIPTAHCPIAADPPESPGRTQVEAMIELIVRPLPPSVTVVSTALIVPQVQPVRLPDLQRLAPTMPAAFPTTVIGGDD